MTQYEKANVHNLVGGARASANIALRSMDQLTADFHIMFLRLPNVTKRGGDIVKIKEAIDKAMHELKIVVDLLPNTADTQYLISQEEK